MYMHTTYSFHLVEGYPFNQAIQLKLKHEKFFLWERKIDFSTRQMESNDWSLTGEQ